MLANGFEIHVRGEVPRDLLDELEHVTAVEAAGAVGPRYIGKPSSHDQRIRRHVGLLITS